MAKSNDRYYLYRSNLFYFTKFISSGIFAFLLFGGALTVLRLGFSNPKLDTTQYTNYGFAVLAAIASICFSWSRSIQNDPDKSKKVNFNGERVFFGSLLFLSASLFKYLYLKMDKPDIIMLWGIGKWLCYSLFLVLFSIAYVLSADGMYEIIRVLFPTQFKKPDKERVERIREERRIEKENKKKKPSE